MKSIKIDKSDYTTSTSRRTSSAKNLDTLRELSVSLEQAIKTGKKALLILDIDSTLLDTSYRTGGIFKEFALSAYHNSLYPDLCSAIKNWGNTKEVYDPIEFINTHSKDYIVQPESDLAKTLLSFWKERFFNESWLNHDLPYLGSQAFVHKHLVMGVDIAYLTGREEKTLLNGTIKSLLIHGFPYNPGSKHTRLMLKSSSHIKDLVYKDEGITEFKQGYDKVIFIDNEIELVEMAIIKHPDVSSYVFDSVHSKRSKTKASELPRLIDGWSVKKN
jgi:hypothetical protein